MKISNKTFGRLSLIPYLSVVGEGEILPLPLKIKI